MAEKKTQEQKERERKLKAFYHRQKEAMDVHKYCMKTVRKKQ